MPNADLVRILQVISLLGAAVLSTKLLINGLWKRYPVFFWYFVFRIANTAWPLLIPNGSGAYEPFWILTEPVSWTFHILVVVELCRLVLTGHRGIYSLLRWAMSASVIIAVGISILSLLPKIQPRMNLDTRVLGFWFATQRGLDFALAIFLLLILFVLSRYPMRLSRNVLLHAALYTIFFFEGALTTFLRVLAVSGPQLRVINLWMAGLSALCIFAWVFLLSPRGEGAPSLPPISPRHEQHALRQLEALNATLLKVAIK
jgi:hypothetical protein